MPVTVAEIAARVGKSAQLVSAVLNGGRSSSAASAATRELILAAAAQLGYRANAAAKAVSTGRSGNAMLVQSRRDEFSWLPQRLVFGLQAGLAEQGRALLVASFPDEQLSDDAAMPLALREHRADGLLLNYNTSPPARLAAIVARHRIPAIWLNHRRAADCVHPDDVQAGALMAGHLAGLGHRRILYADAFLRNGSDMHYSRADRHVGWRGALAGSGAHPSELLPEQRSADLAGTFEAALRRLRPTAVAAYSSVEASAALIAAARLGIKVPRDLSVIVVHHEQLYIGIEVTTVLNPMEEVGRVGAQRLAAKIDAPRKRTAPVAIPFGLLAGESCAAAPR